MSIQHSLIKLDATIKLAQEFAASSFPHEDSKEAVEQLLDELHLIRGKLQDGQAEDLVAPAQRLGATIISDALETLGIIANSANVRNAFEIHGPVVDLARRLLKNSAVRLILTFEWKYMPYALPVVPSNMKNFVVIGLPASEAANALVLPMIGHELGHLLWGSRKAKVTVTEMIKAKVEEITATKLDDLVHLEKKDAGKLIEIENAIEWSLRQLEEVYCDLVGLHLFGSSYLDCFGYMLDPPPMEHRDHEYPTIKSRAGFLEANGAAYRAEIHDFADNFADETNPLEQEDGPDRRALRLADDVVARLAPEIAVMVTKACEEIPFASSSEVDAVVRSFHEGVPAEHAGSLDAILNGGWTTFNSDDFLGGEPGDVRIGALNELILKSIEILEIEKIMTHAAEA